MNAFRLITINYHMFVLSFLTDYKKNVSNVRPTVISNLLLFQIMELSVANFKCNLHTIYFIER